MGGGHKAFGKEKGSEKNVESMEGLAGPCDTSRTLIIQKSKKKKLFASGVTAVSLGKGLTGPMAKLKNSQKSMLKRFKVQTRRL